MGCLEYLRKNVWEQADGEKRKKILEIAEDFKTFNDRAKTERLAVKELLARAEKHGFCDIEKKERLACGDKVYLNDRGKLLILAVIGEKPATEGVNLVVSHIDCARLDLRILPLYEDGGFAMLKTSTYSYEKLGKWTTLPLALHGTVALGDGSIREVSFGEREEEPVLYITDLSVHYSSAQMKAPNGSAYDINKMSAFAGSYPTDQPENASPVKENILRLLYEKYGMMEEDFVSAELELVPAGRTRDAGLDGSGLCGYGFDDRIAAYAQLNGTLAIDAPRRTAVSVFVDKEEAGMEGHSSSKSSVIDYFQRLLLVKTGLGEGNLALDVMNRHTDVLSLEGILGYDPNYPEMGDSVGASKLGCGLQLYKYPMRTGKLSCSETDAEYMGKIRKVFNDSGIIWQPFGEKEGEGGFATVGTDFACRNMNVIDAAICVLGAHSPYEFALKSDLYEACLACRVFFEKPE